MVHVVCLALKEERVELEAARLLGRQRYGRGGANDDKDIDQTKMHSV